jgi:acyl-CoA synthetase (NDP forming)
VTTPDAARTIDLRPLFAPRSMALVGASPRSDTARMLRENIARVGGTTRPYWVNPKYDEVDGARCYPDLGSLPEVPDVVVALVNPLRAAAVVRDAAAIGVPAAIVPGGGVIEGGEPAARMQAEVAAIARASGMALLGPNCMGVVDLHAPSATYIDDLPADLRRGGTAAIAQSGSVANAFINAGPRIGWSRIISCGSEVVLDTCDYLAACLDDPVTDSVVLFVEGFKRPERFLALADRALAAGIPVMAVKVGRSPQARAATVSHSGTLAGDERATDAALRAAGVILCDDLDGLMEAASLWSAARRLGRRVGRGRTGLVAVSTGEASLIADTAPRIGLDLPAIPGAARAAILDAVPTLTHLENPIDPWGTGDAAPIYRTTLGALAGSGAFDVVGLVHDFPYASAQSETRLVLTLGAELIAAVGPETGVLPVLVSLTSGDVPREIVTQMDSAGGVPVLRGIGSGLAAIPRIAWWEHRRADRAAHGPVRGTWPTLAAATPPFGLEGGDRVAVQKSAVAARQAAPGRLIPERESLEQLAAAGIPVVASIAVEGRRAAAILPGAIAAAEQVGWPVAVKLDAPGLAHKSDIGAVELDVANPTQMAGAIRRVLAAGRDHAPDGVLIQPMARRNVELIVGARRDPQFGPLVLVGLGGVLAEIIDDVVLGLAPLRPEGALELLGNLRHAHVLDGVRGRRPIKRDAVAAVLVRLADAMLANPDWLEVDINPLMASSTGALAVDALIVADTQAPDRHVEDSGGVVAG